jgi:translation initiation factor eIF-2B subunit delta
MPPIQTAALPAGPAKLSRTSGETKTQSQSAAGGKPAERGPKLDMSTLTKAEKRALAAKQQELAKAKRAGPKKEPTAGATGAPADASATSSHKAGPGKTNAPAKTNTPAPTKPKTTVAHKPTDTNNVINSSNSINNNKRKPSDEGTINADSTSSSAQSVSVSLEGNKRVPYFMHLADWTDKGAEKLEQGVVLHTEVIRLGFKYANGSICGSSARCVALVKAMECVVRDYELPPKTEFSRHFYENLKPMIRFLVQCRPKAVSMGNFIRGFKNKITQCRGKSEGAAKAFLLTYLDEFIEERFLTAQQLIVDTGMKKIVDGDVIMVYGCSYVVGRLLIAAHEEGKKFQLIVVEGEALMEGKEMLRRMSSVGISCTYVLLNAISYMMATTTKVFLGAAAMLSNGNLVSRVGTALVAMSAHGQYVPVIVCCETIKFSEKCILDSITWNELGNPNDLNDCPALDGWRDASTRLTLLSLRYDVTPIEYLAMIVCEFGMIPPTSVPVVLREYDVTDRLKE